MKINILNKILLLILLSIFCFQFYLNAKEINTQPGNKTDTAWKYLGRPRPGLTPLRFPPDSLLANNNWMWHGTPIFSPDLKEMFWGKYDRIINRGQLAYIRYINNNWTSMQNVPFGNLNYFENNPFFSYTGDTLFFISGRPGGFIFRVFRISGGWTNPVPVNIPIPSGYTSGLKFSIAKSGTIYFELQNTSPNAEADLYKTRCINGQYQQPESLGNVINSDSSDISPYIDPYERFIIFSSKRPGGYGLHDIYLSSRRPDSTWNNPVNLGNTINTSFEDAFPYITPDSLYFFFTTARYGDIGYNPYWISAQYIYNLVSVGVKELSSELKEFTLEQNYPNPFNPDTKIKFEIPGNIKRKTLNVKLTVYNILGEEIETLVNDKLNPGTYEVTFNGSKLSSGIYFYRLEIEDPTRRTGDFLSTKKMILTK